MFVHVKPVAWTKTKSSVATAAMVRETFESKRTKRRGDARTRHFMAACDPFSLNPTGFVPTL
jgi:hypothetical protein